MKTRMESLLEQVQDEYNDMMRLHAEDVKSIEEKIAKKFAVYSVIEEGSGTERVIRGAKQTGESVEVWLLNAINDALYLREGEFIQVSKNVYDRLQSIATNLGRNLNDMTSDDNMSKVILSAIVKGEIS